MLEVQGIVASRFFHPVNGEGNTFCIRLAVSHDEHPAVRGDGD